MPRCSGLGACQRPTSAPSAVAATTIAGGARLVASIGVELGDLHVEADVPARAVPADRGEQDFPAWRHDRLPGVGIAVGDRAEQPPQSAGVVVDADRADPRQGHGAGMALTDPDQGGATLALLVAEPEAVPTAPLAFEPREAD